MDGKEDLKQKIDEYTRQIKENPNDAKYYYNRGGLYSDLQQYERAVQDYNKSIELNPNSGFAKHFRDMCLQAMGK